MGLSFSEIDVCGETSPNHLDSIQTFFFLLFYRALTFTIKADFQGLCFAETEKDVSFVS